jgi:hypothetical protein
MPFNADGDRLTGAFASFLVDFLVDCFVDLLVDPFLDRLIAMVYIPFLLFCAMRLIVRCHPGFLHRVFYFTPKRAHPALPPLIGSRLHGIEPLGDSGGGGFANLRKERGLSRASDVAAHRRAASTTIPV